MSVWLLILIMLASGALGFGVAAALSVAAQADRRDREAYEAEFGHKPDETQDNSRERSEK